MRLKKHRRLLCAAALVFAASLFFSCQSVPRGDEVAEKSLILPDSSDVIIRVDISSSRELIEPVLKSFEGQIPAKLKDEFIDRSETLWAGLDLNSEYDPGSGQAVESSLVVKGDYPKGLINWGLCWDSDWKKSGETHKYWKEKEGDMQIAVASEDLFIASSGSINEMMSKIYSPETAGSGIVIPPDAESEIVIVTRNLSPEDYGMFVQEFNKVPLKRLLLKLERLDDQYLVSGRFTMENQASAFLFSTLFRAMIIAAKNEDGSRLFPTPTEISVRMEEADLVLEGMRLNAEYVLQIEEKWLSTAGF